ncbi:DUF2786 domain-containing protein [Micromonospora sp. NPDC049559]|uniref:DUF2786 domain-containing protein n=1 Tax=Micromonospora sp. NPDC049559 TaxID=3155923 RepID=UPI00343EB7F2
MGVRNQQRRAAKKKAREQRQRRRDEAAAASDPFGLGPFGQPSAEKRTDDLLRETVFAFVEPQLDRIEPLLDRLTVSPPETVDRRYDLAVRDVMAQVWARGWMPAELIRVTRRKVGKRPAAFLLEQVAASLRGHAAATVDERWHAQLRELGVAVWEGFGDHRVSGWARRQGLDRSEALRDAVRCLALLVGLPEIGVIAPLPGTARPAGTARAGAPGAAGAGGAGPADERLLGRVRGLLAKAESTEFPEEAEALSAKAQELMTRHSIDRALLDAGPGPRTAEPIAVRVGVEAPYEPPKALLLQHVAEANRCRSVWSADLGFATVFGYPADSASVELLYTSLLVQATAAMVHDGPRTGSGGGSSKRSFRQSFLHAYAVRIGERLRGAADEASRAAVEEEGADRLLPVLAARDDRVREAVDEMFPDMVTRAIRGGGDEAGWAAGTAAADLAALGARSGIADS